ncbi:MAG TPA: hypothetical protein VGL59_00540 [Polyangia bacterium]|jgi:hypothetical protein
MMGGVMLMLMLVLADTTPPLDAVWATARQYDRDSFRFTPPTDERENSMRSLISAVAKTVASGKSPQACAADAQKLGLELQPARDAAGPVWTLHESASQRRGDGFYVFRADGAPLCLQAPHIFFDQGTGEVALEVFAETKAACLFTNTVHRYAKSDAGEKMADVAHADRTLFKAATEGLLQARPMPIVQLHGFGDKRQLPRDVLAVVADGTSQPPVNGPAARLRTALQPLLPPGRIWLFGSDTHELGATTNVEAALARKAGVAFVHLEMNETLRRHLRANGGRAIADSLRQIFSRQP